MKKRKIPTIRIKDLAKDLDADYANLMQLTKIDENTIAYKDYVVKKTQQGNWAIFKYPSKNLVEQFYLKTCAIMAAKAHSQVNLQKFQEIKRLDNLYWSNYSNVVIFQTKLKTAKDLDRYLILLNRLEESKIRKTHYQTEISQMFTWSFV